MIKSREEVLEILIRHGIPIDKSNLYADAFIEYQIANESIQKTGSIVKHPRTGNPMENPYLNVRDRAWKKLNMLRRFSVEELWK